MLDEEHDGNNNLSENEDIVDINETLFYAFLKSEKDSEATNKLSHGLKFMSSGTITEVDPINIEIPPGDIQCDISSDPEINCNQMCSPSKQDITNNTTRIRSGSNPELETKRVHHCKFPTCRKSYTKSSHLKAHQRIHTGKGFSYWFFIKLYNLLFR